jgi:N-carbamoyl-L-amino-acid hydrolase
VITAADLGARLAGLEPIGLADDGTTRLAWTAEDGAAAEWFAAQAGRAGLEVERDPAGNLWARPATPPPWWGVGSHLDSVRSGGRFDGALGVAAAFEVALRSSKPVAVISFADEEGARFNTPTFGSRALVGRLDVDDALARVDDEGVRLADAIAGHGVDPAGLAGAPNWLSRLKGFTELHIDQTRDLAAAGAPAGVVRALASRMRLRIELAGQADHAGTTPRRDRRDALAAAARLIVAADELAPHDDFVVTASRILVEPNALTTVPGHVVLYVDARTREAGELDAFRARLVDTAAVIAVDRGVAIAVETAAESDGVEFDPVVRAAIAAAAPGAPEVVCFAGHDAGVLAEKIPAGMVFVRNETGVSHAPDEKVFLEDAAVAARALLAAVEELA